MSRPPTVVDYYFTPVSPWAYLGHARFVALLAEHGASVNVRPVDYGVIFPRSGGLPLGQRAPQRQAYRLVELERFSRWLEVPLNPTPTHFPVTGDPASRLIIAADQALGPGAALEVAGRVGRAIWAEQRHAGEPATLQAIVDEAGLPTSLLAAADDPAIAERFAGYTQQALDAGVFGAPSYVVDGEIFWGQDRLDFLARRLAQD